MLKIIKSYEDLLKCVSGNLIGQPFTEDLFGKDITSR